MKPYILLTVYRRYFELDRAINQIWKAVSKGEFSDSPDVTLVWAQPEEQRLWYIDRLLQQQKIHQVVFREKLPLEGARGGTTYPESRNLRSGIESIVSRNQESRAYIIGQAADILPRQGAYRLLDEKMDWGANAVVFRLNNPRRQPNLWHTNFFAVSLDEQYWPPVVDYESSEILEFHWGKQLASTDLTAICTIENAPRWFAHEHLSETQPEWSLDQRGVSPPEGDHHGQNLD